MNKELTLSSEVVTINGHPVRKIYGGFRDDQPCILAKQVAELHEYDLGEINRIVNRNTDWFDEGIDIIDLKNEIISGSSSGMVSNHPSDFLIKSGFYANSQAVGGAKYIYLFSQQGYALLCKLLKSDLARQIYKQMVREYFIMKEKLENRSARTQTIGDMLKIASDLWKLRWTLCTMKSPFFSTVFN
ncbi:ORF6N domain-containing protein [Desulfonema magnum]|uniref:DNA-binding domain-containing protein, KilA-N-like n=1 Tax=Desulfonema magnum TaxID=45655 RepID=A0A975BXE9_9BACT|nr:ORF6N domain-containing protein [Desulfonema magnum]QTA93576.1 DNA-binding domain-containing protein, KilA-N-like [Desulfonema magnum]